MFHGSRLLAAAALALLMSACTVQPATPVVDPAPRSAANSTESSDRLSGEITVYAAASLTDAFGAIAANFTAAHPDTEIVYNFAGSQQLAQQLGQGAPADVFASANGRQMEVAITAGRVVSGTQRTFVRNRLVVIYPVDNQADITTLQDLTKPGLKLVLAAAEAPVGAYSLDFLNKAAANVDFGGTYSKTVLANVVSYEENVRSVLSKVVLGEADAGIVYSSDVFGDSAAQVGQIEIPDALNTVASYPIATVMDSRNPAVAQAFVEHLLSPEGQATLAEFGFVPVATP